MTQHRLFNVSKANRLSYDNVRRTPDLAITDSDIVGVVDAQGAFFNLEAEGDMPAFQGGLPVPKANRGLIRNVLRLLNIARQARVMFGFATEDYHPWGSVSLASSYHDDLVAFLLSLSPDGQTIILNAALLGQWKASNSGVNPLKDHAIFDEADLLDYLSRANGNYQILWPDHALEDDIAEMVPESIRRHSMVRVLLRKGFWGKTDSYGGGTENNGDPTGLIELLLVWAAMILARTGRKPRIFLVGIAGDVCLAFTAMQLIAAGFEVIIIIDGQASIAAPIAIDANGEFITTEEDMLDQLWATGKCQFTMLEDVERNSLVVPAA